MKTTIRRIFCCALVGASAALTQETFTEITVGPHVTDLGSSGYGCWGDCDGDGYADLSVSRYAGARVIYRNNGDGTFSLLAPPSLTPGFSGPGAWGDWDNDGRHDLINRFGDARYIGFGDGDGDFVPTFVGVAEPYVSCGIADYDRDGWLDMYLSWANRFYRNSGDRSFVSLPLDEVGYLPGAYGCACWGDFDDDGWSDLFLPSVRESHPYLFRNEEGRLVAIDNLITRTTAPTLNGAWGDYDNDGRLDLFVVGFNGTSTLYRNLGDGEFEHPDGAPTVTGTHNFTAWADYDNDGFLDLWISGYMSGNKLFRNDGDGSFTRITTESLVTARPLNNAGTYAVAWFDYDNDGFLDVYLLNGDDNNAISTANQLFHNNGNGNTWLTVKPIGTSSNRDAIGAKVRVLATYAGQARWQRRDISGGDIHNSNQLYAHFGLGDAAQVDLLRIEWPSGMVQELKDVTPNQILTVTEPPRLIPQGVGKFQIQCWVNQSFEVQCSIDLSTWATAASVTNTTDTLVFEDAAADQHDCRYYRVVVP